MPGDRIAITEYMNAEWWKGRNERTGQEGIFPRSYVNVSEEKGPTVPAAADQPQPSNYGNMPLVKEVRAFIRGGQVVCAHPYWPPGAVALDDTRRRM